MAASYRSFILFYNHPSLGSIGLHLLVYDDGRCKVGTMSVGGVLFDMKSIREWFSGDVIMCLPAPLKKETVLEACAWLKTDECQAFLHNELVRLTSGFAKAANSPVTTGIH